MLLRISRVWLVSRRHDAAARPAFRIAGTPPMITPVAMGGDVMLQRCTKKKLLRKGSEHQTRKYRLPDYWVAFFTFRQRFLGCYLLVQTNGPLHYGHAGRLLLQPIIKLNLTAQDEQGVRDI